MFSFYLCLSVCRLFLYRGLTRCSFTNSASCQTTTFVHFIPWVIGNSPVFAYRYYAFFVCCPYNPSSASTGTESVPAIFGICVLPSWCGCLPIIHAKCQSWIISSVASPRTIAFSFGSHSFEGAYLADANFWCLGVFRRRLGQKEPNMVVLFLWVSFVFIMLGYVVRFLVRVHVEVAVIFGGSLLHPMMINLVS